MVEAEKNGPQPQGAATTSSFEVTADYLGGLVHELRNPLSPIRTATELLRSLSSDPRQLQAIDLISRQVVTLTHMLDDLIEAARGHRGLLALVRRSIDMAELIERVLEAVRPTIDAQRQNLFVSLPSTPVHMECDPLRLGQVLQVLLHNAIQYTPPGGSLALRARRDGAELVMEVSDDGAGIAAEALPHLFNVFARSPPNGALTAQDVGFSLALARNVIELHGGRLTAASEGVGRGSTFTLRLPIRYEASAPELTKEGPDARPLRIIIIDDHQESVRGWLECMVRAGHSVLTAENGELALLLASQFQPDAVVVDIGLPGIDGFEVARALRAQPSTRHAVLIAVSGYSLKQFRDLEAYSVFRHYLLKPVSANGLLHIIEHTVADIARAASGKR